jgi:hypothetical protein
MLLLIIGIGLMTALGVAAARPPRPPEHLPALPPVATGKDAQVYRVGDLVVILSLAEWARVTHVSQDGQRFGCRLMCGCAAVYTADALAK